MHAHVSQKSHNTQLSQMFECLGMYCISLVYGMVESHILSQLLLLVFERVPLDCEEVPFSSCAYIHFIYALLCSIMCTKREVILVLVWLILESFPFTSIFVLGVSKHLHLRKAWSSSGSLDNLPWLRSSSIVQRNMLMWIFVVVLN